MQKPYLFRAYHKRLTDNYCPDLVKLSTCSLHKTCVHGIVRGSNFPFVD